MRAVYCARVPHLTGHCLHRKHCVCYDKILADGSKVISFLQKSRLSRQLSDREVKCVEEVPSCSDSHVSTVWMLVLMQG